MASDLDHRVLEVARAETKLLVEAGAQAVYMTGSHARGDAHPESDVDLRVIGEGSSPELKRHDEFLISTSWQTRDQNESVFEDPAQVGEVVPGWREAVILHDPNDVAAAFKNRSGDWSWDEIEDECDEWVAAQITEYAEEVHTLIGNIDQDQFSGAAAIRSQLALHLAQVLSVHKRILYGSENVLWAKIADAMGEDYARNQELALGLREGTFVDSCRAALNLFQLAVGATEKLLSGLQRPVVDHACVLATRPLPEN